LEYVLGKVRVRSLILQNAVHPSRTSKLLFVMNGAELYLEELTVALLRKKSPAFMQPKGSVPRSQESAQVPIFV
jgi:hypothetical protein